MSHDFMLLCFTPAPHSPPALQTIITPYINIIIMQPQSHYPLSPLHSHTLYTAHSQPLHSNEYHPILGYPICPLIGRYNKGEYRIGEVLVVLGFVGRWKQESKEQQGQSKVEAGGKGQGKGEGKAEMGYYCGYRKLDIPGRLVQLLRNIPEVIPYNRPKNAKQHSQFPVHELQHVPQPTATLTFHIHFGEIGNDFLNYLNHTYIFDESVFYGDKLNRTSVNIPIVAYLPEGSGLNEGEVERGISMDGFRSQYLSIHLKGGAPAFSPNNMRLGVKGMRRVGEIGEFGVRKEKGEKGKAKKYKEKKQSLDTQQNKKDKQESLPETAQKPQQQQSADIPFCWQQLQKQIQTQSTQTPSLIPSLTPPLPPTVARPKFVHLYTAVLLQKDHRVNYHWLVEDADMQDTIRGLLRNSQSLQAFVEGYRGFLGQDALVEELGRLLLI